MSFTNVASASNAVQKAQFDYSGDIYTSFDFGECQPTHCRLLVSAGKNKISTQHILRLSPLSRPAFGRLRFHQYHQFVRMSDLFPQFDDFLAGTQRLNNAETNSKTIVESLPTIPSNLLMIALLHTRIGRAKNFVSRRNQGTSDPADSIANAWIPFKLNCVDHGLQSMIPHDRRMFVTKTCNIDSNGAVVTTGGTEVSGIITTELNSPSLTKAPWNPDYSDFTGYQPRGYKSPYTLVSGDTIPTQDWLWHIKLTKRGLRLYKIFLALGYKPTFKPEFDYCALPLIAYYKAWWDIMRLPQYHNWQDTSAWRLIKWYEMNGTYKLDLTKYTTASKQLLNLWFDFLEDLCGCFYSSNADFVSCHEPLPSSGNYGLPMQRNDERYDLSGVQWHDIAGYSSKNDIDNVDFGAATSPSYPLSHLDIDYLMKAYYWCQQKTEIGYQLAEIIKAKGYETRLKGIKSAYIGKSSEPITVSEVISTAETATADLGDYAGKASQTGSTGVIKYYNDEVGYIISFGCILPDPSTTMSIDPTLLAVNTGSEGGYRYYSPMEDGLGRMPSPRAIIGYENVYEYTAQKNGTGTHYPLSFCSDKDTFGTAPAFVGFKVGRNIRNGCLSLNSQRNTFLPWTMDRVTRQADHKISDTTYDPTSYHIDVCNSLADLHSVPNAGEHWRYWTKYPELCNYSRIFIDGKIQDAGNLNFDLVTGIPTNEDNDPSDDFMMVMHYTHIATQNMLPVSRTWDTMDEEQERTGAGTFNIKK